MLAYTSAKQMVIAGRLQALLREAQRVRCCCYNAVALSGAACSQQCHSCVSAQQQQQQRLHTAQTAAVARAQRLLQYPLQLPLNNRLEQQPALHRTLTHPVVQQQQWPTPCPAVQPPPNHMQPRGSRRSALAPLTSCAGKLFGDYAQQMATKSMGSSWQHIRCQHSSSPTTWHESSIERKGESSTRANSGVDSSKSRLFKWQADSSDTSKKPTRRQHEKVWAEAVEQQRQQTASTAVCCRRSIAATQGAVEAMWKHQHQEYYRGQAEEVEQHQQLQALQHTLSASQEASYSDSDYHGSQIETKQQLQHQDQQQQQQNHLSFASIGVAPELVQVLQQESHITVPTPVQVQAMQPVATGRHVAIQSATGTGKTLAYLLPLMSIIKPWQQHNRHERHGRVVILAPTQELCMQIVRAARSLIPTDRQSVMPLVGGSNFVKALRSLNKHKPWLIVATPGRFSAVMGMPDLFRKAFPWASRTRSNEAGMTLVLEEAPKLLSMDDTKHVLANLAPKNPSTEEMSGMARILRYYQLILVSASLKPSTLAAAPAWAEADPVMITAPPPPPGLIHGAQTPATDTATSGQATGRPQMLPSTITHQMLTYDRTMTSMEKLLLKCLRHYKHQGQKVLVFVGDKDKLAQLGERLTADAKSMKVGCVHGRLDPNRKMDYIRRFNQGRLDALLVSDGFALGLDFKGVDVVMQVGSLPASTSQYTHRAGRCGRMGRQGTVLSLIAADGVEQFSQIIKRLDIELQEVAL